MASNPARTQDAFARIGWLASGMCLLALRGVEGVQQSPAFVAPMPSKHSLPIGTPLGRACVPEAAIVRCRGRSLLLSAENEHESNSPVLARSSRRQVAIGQSMAMAAACLGVGVWGVPPAQALVKGNAPPPNMKSRMLKPESRSANMEDAMEKGRQKEEELFAQAEDGEAFQTTPQGDRYKDMVMGQGATLKQGDRIDIRYRALRLGKRSRDGLSGEATTVFSLGYGEDDDKDGDVLPLTLGQDNVIPALEAALVGMRVGGTRRVLVRPERGWYRGGGGGGCGVALDGMNVNSLAASFIVPGTKIQDQEDCLDLTRVPAPTSYAARRRMGRRFDESLIIEVAVVSSNK